jgi:hypothetical protein
VIAEILPPAVAAAEAFGDLLIDAATHPRFAVGESTIPYTSAVTKIIAARYHAEIDALSGFRTVHEKITPMCGRKQNFGFVYHREGQPQDPALTNQRRCSAERTPDDPEPDADDPQVRPADCRRGGEDLRAHRP